MPPSHTLVTEDSSSGTWRSTVALSSSRRFDSSPCIPVQVQSHTGTAFRLKKKKLRSVEKAGADHPKTQIHTQL